MGRFEARETRSSNLPIPPDRSGGTLNLTVLEDECRVAAVGRAASCAHSYDGKSRVANTRR